MSKRTIVVFLIASALVVLAAWAAGSATQREQAQRQKPASADKGPGKFRAAGAPGRTDLRLVSHNAREGGGSAVWCVGQRRGRRHGHLPLVGRRRQPRVLAQNTIETTQISERRLNT